MARTQNGIHRFAYHPRQVDMRGPRHAIFFVSPPFFSFLVEIILREKKRTKQAIKNRARVPVVFRRRFLGFRVRVFKGLGQG